ncbi:fasciclin domain-containing protein [Sphingobacterium olei]|nr:fasciclin domain-containing protein [Sphingobacterium olei]
MLFNKYSLCWLLLFLTISSCRKAAFDEFYGRPDWLESAIYSKLQEEGRFSMILKLIDKAGYQETLNQAGYWTFFAPNDEAVKRFLTEQGIADIEAISVEMAEKIVRNALVYNAFKTDRISDYQSNLGWVEGMAFRRRTAYYDGFRKEVVKINGVEQELVVAASNRNNMTVSFGTPYYVDGDNNNKYVTYFHSKYAALNNLTASDYTFFHPNVNWTDFNFMGSKVVKANIIAENGIIHEVDAVNLPQLSLDQYITQNDDYSFFRDSILNPYFVTYQPNAAASKTYEYRTGQTAQVYIKTYDPMLAFSPNNENYLKMEDNDGQMDAYTLFIPKNDVLIPWVRNVLLEHYKTLGNVPKTVLADFVNTLFWQSAVWPSQFAEKTNIHEEPARFQLSDISDKKILSNGFLYGTSKMQESDLFNTVYRHIVLDPAYSLMLNLLNKEYRRLIINPDKEFTVFLFSDRLLSQLGYLYDDRISSWTWRDRNGNVQGHSVAEPRLQRILYSHIVETPNNELGNIANTSGFIQAGDNSIPGEYIKWSNGKLYAAGNELLNQPVQIVGSAKFGNNGRIYYVDNLLEFSGESSGQAIQRIVSQNPELGRFRDYLINSTLYVAADLTIKGVSSGSSYTFLMPNNDAVQQAIDDGLLPANPLTADLAERVKVERFILYHMLSNVNLAPDGNREILSAITMMKDENDQSQIVGINNAPQNLRIVDKKGRSISVVNNTDLYISNRIVLHELNGYLNYNE